MYLMYVLSLQIVFVGWMDEWIIGWMLLIICRHNRDVHTYVCIQPNRDSVADGWKGCNAGREESAEFELKEYMGSSITVGISIVGLVELHS